MSCQCCRKLPARENLPTGYKGSTYGGTNFLIQGGGVYDKLVGVTMVFTLSGADSPALTVTQDDGMLITDDSIGNWEFQMLAIIDLSLEKGTYTYTLECTGDSGIQTYYFNGTWEIK